MEETKRELPEGLYEATVPLRGNPAELRGKMMRYLAPNTLGKAEDEESAMRIIWPSIEQGQWVGVTWKYMVKVMRTEQERAYAVEAEQMLKSKKQWLKAKAERQEYLFFCLLTLGVYCLFVKWPKLVRLETPNIDDIPVSVVPLYGASAIVEGVNRLLKKKLITIDFKDGFEIIFPTQELIDAVTKTA